LLLCRRPWGETGTLVTKASQRGRTAQIEPGVAALTLVLGIMIVVGLVATLRSYPRTIAADPSAVGAVGLWLSAWGLGISTIGFGVTWWQLYRTATAAQRVSNALDGIRRDYATFDVSSELRTAKAAGEDAIAALEGGRWGDAVQAHDKARSSLVKMASVNGGLSEDQSGRAKDYAADMLSACDAISEKRQDDGVAIPVQKMTSNLRNLNTFLIELEQQLRGGIGG
jgi:hypothetical protein